MSDSEKWERRAVLASLVASCFGGMGTGLICTLSVIDRLRRHSIATGPTDLAIGFAAGAPVAAIVTLSLVCVSAIIIGIIADKPKGGRK